MEKVDKDQCKIDVVILSGHQLSNLSLHEIGCICSLMLVIIHLIGALTDTKMRFIEVCSHVDIGVIFTCKCGMNIMPIY